MTAFILSRQLDILAAAAVIAVFGIILHVRDARRAERQASERAAAYVADLTPEEIAEILADRRPS